MSEIYESPVHDWFGLSYASFLTLPRILMQEMPLDWQNRMVGLLREYEEEFPNQPDIYTRVQIVKDGKLIKTPIWLLAYRRPGPHRDMINSIRKNKK